MTWPTSQIAETSAAATWNKLCSDAFQAKQATAGVRVKAEAGQLAPSDLRPLSIQLRAARALLNSTDGDLNVQAYARLVSGDPAFALSAESGILKPAYAAVIQQARALFNASQPSMGTDGAVKDAVAVIPVADCAALIAACQALESAIA